MADGLGRVSQRETGCLPASLISRAFQGGEGSIRRVGTAGKPSWPPRRDRGGCRPRGPRHLTQPKAPRSTLRTTGGAAGDVSLSPSRTAAAKTEIGRVCPPDPSPMWYDRVIFRRSCTRGIPFGRLACQGLL